MFLFCSSLHNPFHCKVLGHRMPLVWDHFDQRTRANLAELRRLLPRLEGLAPEARRLSFGLPPLDASLQGGLAFGALHEMAPETEADMAAAFGFLVALLGRIPGGSILLVLGSRKFARCGRPYGNGLAALGLDPARLILVEAGSNKDALWAMEEALRSTAPAAVAGTIDRCDFRSSQRLHLAAGDSRRPLLLLRPAGSEGTSVAVTRWRVGAAPAARDRFGLIARPRWQVKLERSRHGRPGEWLVEFDHAYGFSLAAALAHPALSRAADTESRKQAG
jgi:protein ImuA